MRQHNPYHVLGVSEGASAAEVRSAYLNRVKVLHPDRFDKEKQSNEWQIANDMLQELNVAYNQLQESFRNGDVSNRFKKSATPESKDPYEILSSKIGFLCSVFCRNYPRSDGSFLRSSIDPQECEVCKTSGGFYALKHNTGILIKSGHLVVLTRDAREIGLLPDTFVKTSWKSYLAQKAKAPDWSGGLLAIRDANALSKAVAKWRGLMGFYLHFTNDKGHLEQAVLLGDAQLIEDMVAIA